MKPELPDWPGARLYCSTRQGGVSIGAYQSLNLGDHVDDDPVNVAENRRLLANTWGARPVFMRQVHGTQLVCIDQTTEYETPEADACWSTKTGLACTIMVADCLPVLFYLPHARVVAAAHAGWRGLASGVLQATLNKLAAFGSLRDLKVWLGPCIGPLSFQVGEEVMKVFCSNDATAMAWFRQAAQPEKYLADLAGLARHRLHQAGVEELQGNDSTPIWCTFTQKDLYFSHRRDRISGRFAAAISLV